MPLSHLIVFVLYKIYHIALDVSTVYTYKKLVIFLNDVAITVLGGLLHISFYHNYVQN